MYVKSFFEAKAISDISSFYTYLNLSWSYSLLIILGIQVDWCQKKILSKLPIFMLPVFFLYNMYMDTGRSLLGMFFCVTFMM